jgi:C1A family cysteine protease
MKLKYLLLFLIIIFINGSDAIQYDLRNKFNDYGINIKDQKKRNTCSIFAIVGLLEYEFARSKGQNLDLSEEFLNWSSNIVGNNNLDGSFFYDAITALSEYGICEEKYMKYNDKYDKNIVPSLNATEDASTRKEYTIFWIKKWNIYTGFNNDQLNLIINMIKDEHPVAVGIRWPKKEQYINHILYIPQKEDVFDGHSILLVGFSYDDKSPGGGYFIFKNSAGVGYRDKGYGKIPFEYFSKYGNDAVAISIK